MKFSQNGIAAGILKPGTNHNEAASAYAVPAAQVHQWLVDPTTQPTNRKIAFLTFDDGPSSITIQVLDVLRGKGVHATFFVIGPQLRAVNSSVLTTLLGDGNAVALHTWSHNYRYLYPGRVGDATHIVCDVQAVNDGTTQVLGGDFHTSAYRYPGGHGSWRQLELADASLAQRGYSWIDWNALSGDAEPKGKAPTTSAAMLDYFKASIMESQRATGRTNVLVILNHDSSGATLSIQTLPAMIDYLKAQGYEFGVIE